MAHFYGQLQGSRGEATRCGNKNEGIRGHIRGWDVGVRVEGYYDDELGDFFNVYVTSGSNGGRSDKHMAQVCIQNGIPVFIKK